MAATALLSPPESSISGEALASKDAAIPVYVAPKFLPTPEASFTEADSSQDTVVEGPASKKVRLSSGTEAPA
jgi:hypothetical protein